MTANRRRWTLGDRRWGATHRGRTYLFSGPDQQRRFLADPDRYAPVLSGNDAVLAVEEGRAVPGRRQHGVFFNDRVYLFSNEESLDKFTQNPHHYASEVLQAVQAGNSRGPHRR
jgi:YHS domain-containing protein